MVGYFTSTFMKNEWQTLIFLQNIKQYICTDSAMGIVSIVVYSIVSIVLVLK